MRKKVKRLSVVCAAAVVALSLPICASSMRIAVSNDLDNSSGDVEVDGVYMSGNSAYDVNVYGVRGTAQFVNSFAKTGSTINTAMNLGFDSQTGYVNATEKIGTQGASEDSDNSSSGEYVNAAVGLGVSNSFTSNIKTEGVSSNDPNVSYNINQAQGNGQLSIGANAYSYKYTDTVSPANCPFKPTAIKVAGSEEYYKFKQKTTGIYNYTGKFNIGK
jgi:hypothetical protein